MLLTNDQRWWIVNVLWMNQVLINHGSLMVVADWAFIWSFVTFNVSSSTFQTKTFSVILMFAFGFSSKTVFIGFDSFGVGVAHVHRSRPHVPLGERGLTMIQSCEERQRSASHTLPRDEELISITFFCLMVFGGGILAEKEFTEWPMTAHHQLITDGWLKIMAYSKSWWQLVKHRGLWVMYCYLMKTKTLY